MKDYRPVELTHLTKYSLGDYRDALDRAGILTGCDLSDPGRMVTGLSFDSRDVCEGTLFIAKGLHFRSEYLSAAYSSGAFACVAEKWIGDFPNMMTVSDIRRAMAILAEMFYCDPLASLRSFAVTGTKGKTTSVTFLKRILDLDAKKRGAKPAGISSSVDIFDGFGETEPINTTPEAPDLWKYMARAVEAGLDTFAVEVSSQAIKYRRVDGMRFTVACLTNVGFDHIGPAEHPDFDDYFRTKLRIFDVCEKACVNLDDPLANRMIEYIGGRVPVVTFGSSGEAQVRLSDIEVGQGGIGFRISVPGESRRMKITMPGLFNVKNALYAAAMSYAAGIPLSTVAEALEDARVKGRMLPYRSADGRLEVIIDYAHNGMSFEALFDSLEVEHPGCAFVVIYGWHGNKGENRRKDIGEVTGKRAFFTVITEKDSADEPFEKIASEVGGWIGSAGGRYAVIKDREAALRYAFALDTGGRKKIIVFAGRGEEDWQKYGNFYYFYPPDPVMTLKLLAEYDSVHPAG
ncbi:MAG: UDP-N-acetylmuramyl peptide synthase [Clostridia bacterium]|nr:UDP-N-acetylmuramyl peptide synthase [Clostridia bacterium]